MIKMPNQMQQNVLPATDPQLINQLMGAQGYGYWGTSQTPYGYPPVPPGYFPGAGGAGGPGGSIAYGAIFTETIEHPAVEDTGVRAGEIVAYRCWKATPCSRWLRSVSASTLWIPGEVMEGDPDTMGIGVFAWKKLDAALEMALAYSSVHAIVVGSVELWGTVVEHDHGYRAQFAAIKSFDYILNARWFPGHKLRRLRRLYLRGAPCGS